MTDTRASAPAASVAEKGTSAGAKKEDEVPVEILTGMRLIVVLFALTIACFLVMLDVSVVSTAVPKITDEFHSIQRVGWYAASYQLGSASLQLLTGKMFQHFRLKWTFVALFVIFEIGSAICGAAQSATMLIVGRTVSGIGSAGLLNGALTIVAAAVEMKRRPLITAIVVGIAQLAIVSGPLIGGALTTNVSWRWCFYINLPIGGAVLVLLSLMYVPEQVPKKPFWTVVRSLHRYFDFVGVVLFAPAVVMLLLAMQLGGNTFAWNSSQIIGLFVGAGATALVWLVWNVHMGDDALLPLRAVHQVPIWTSGINYSLVSTVTIGPVYFLPLYFQTVKGVSAITSGVYMLAMILPQLLTTVLAGAFLNRVRYIPILAISGAVLFSLGNGLLSLLRPDTPTGHWVGFMILAGLGRGLAFQMPLMAVQFYSSPEMLAPTMAFIIWCQYLGPSVFITLFNTVFDSKLVSSMSTVLPGVNPQLIISAGATAFRKVVPSNLVPAVLVAFCDAIDVVMYMALACSLATFVAAWFMGWDDVNKDSKGKKRGADEEVGGVSVAPITDDAASHVFYSSPSTLLDHDERQLDKSDKS